MTFLKFFVNKRISNAAFSVLLFISAVNYGQVKTDVENFGDVFLSDFYSAVDDGLKVAESPLEFSQSDWMTVGIITAGTAALFTADKSFRSVAIANQSNLNNAVFGIDRFYGSGYTTLLTAGIYGAGLFTGNEQIRKLGLYSSEALIFSGIVTTVLKVVIGRRRPYAGNSNLFFKPPQFFDNDYQSLPSGHTTVAFAVSTVLAKSVDNIYWKIFWYGAAGATALSRIYHNQHWVSDVFLGAAIGYYVGKFIVKINKTGSVNNSSVRIFPSVSFNGVGVSVWF